MKLDLLTLLWTLTLASSVLATAVLAVAWRARVHRGLALWGLGLVLNALSYPAFGLRVLGWPQSSVVVVNLLTALTLALHTLALRAFQQGRARALPAWPVWLMVFANTALALVFLQDDHWRNILGAACQSTGAGLLLSQAWAPGLAGKRLTGRWVIIGGATLLLVMFVTRTGFMVAQSDWDSHYKVPDVIQAWTYFVALAVLLLNSVGFVLMQMEHAIAEQHELAVHDRLTGLYNRHALVEALARDSAQSQRTGSPLALLMVDIDHFKAVNDQYGHLVGDKVLCEVARRLDRRLRRADMLARFGGEEFLALLPGTNVQEAQLVAEAIRQLIQAAPVQVQGLSIPLTVSIGVHAAVAQGEGESIDALIATSDEALYQAKRQGRNRVVVG